MKRAIAVAAIAALATSACATKRYPIATGFSAAEAAAYDCRQLAIELVKAEEVKLQITETAETDWRSVAGFLGDWGIGNAMAKSEAEKSIQQRITGIRAAQINKNCEGMSVASTANSEAGASAELEGGDTE